MSSRLTTHTCVAVNQPPDLEMWGARGAPPSPGWSAETHSPGCTEPLGSDREPRRPDRGLGWPWHGNHRGDDPQGMIGMTTHDEEIWDFRTIPPKEEVERIFSIYHNKPEMLVELFNGQMRFLSQSCQAVVSLCGLGLTVTGFSGGVIIKAGSLSAALLVGGIIFMVLSAGTALASLALFKWVTEWLHPDLRVVARSCIRDRNSFRKWVVSVCVCGDVVSGW